MNWSDERYVKLYVRDTLTWRAWPWQAKALWPLMLRKLDGAGLIETGRMDVAEAVALQVEMPVEVVRPGLAAIIATGTLREVPGGLEATAFIAAQEARKTEAAKKRDQRERTATQRRNAQVADLRTEPVPNPSHDVPPCPTVSPSSPAQPVPSPAQPERNGADAPTPRPKPKRADPSDADPRHQPFVRGLDEVFREVRGCAYPFKPRDFVAVKALLLTGTALDVLLAAWRRALQHTGYPSVSSPSELHDHLARFVTTFPAAKSPHVVGDWSASAGTQAFEGF